MAPQGMALPRGTSLAVSCQALTPRLTTSFHAAKFKSVSFPTSPKTTRRSGLVKRIGCFISSTEWVEILEVVEEMLCVVFSCCVRCVRRVNCRFRWCFGYAVNGVVCTLGLSPRFLCGCDVIRFQDVRREGGLL